MPSPWKPTTPLKTVADYDIDTDGARLALATATQRATEISDRLDRLPIGSADEATLAEHLREARAAVEELDRTVRRLEHGRQGAAVTAEEARVAALVTRAREILTTVPPEIEEIDTIVHRLVSRAEKVSQASDEFRGLIAEISKAGRVDDVYEGDAKDHPYVNAIGRGTVGVLRLVELKTGETQLWPRQPL